MADLYLLFNHSLTRQQEQSAYQELGVRHIHKPPPEIRRLWAAIPPRQKELRPILTPVFSWMDQELSPGDFLLVQGDFGACCLVADHAERAGIIPVYATTHRQAKERHTRHGQVKIEHTFEHIRFRRYGR